MAESNNGAGFRITLGMVYAALQDQTAVVGRLDTTVKLLDQRVNEVLHENGELRRRTSKLEARLNGILIGLGSGIAGGVFFYFRGTS